ncbi:hypothetical protein CASFOL_003434 [Castilleja foliolosa]|uniref:F-box domain-containing protein n=1 Tax=Castilleja foliolosa TaxID=1961234 RepID=A0ABD3EH64_9LAMI
MDLPRDITIEIFAKLPVKSLMQFKSISISFYNMISSDPLFRKKHLYHQSRFKKVVLVPDHHYVPAGPKIFIPCALLSLSPDAKGYNKAILQIPARKGDSTNGLCFHNCCDGVFCIGMSGGDVVLWNPTTRQTRVFRSCQSQYPNPRWIGYSLAHDPRSDVYKLLGISVYDHNTYKLYFYSIGKGTWMYIEESSACDYVKYDGNTTIVNGAFHWLGSKEEHFRKPHVVVTLDISDEKYGTLALPKAICHNSTAPLLFELKGKLCIFTQHTSNPCRDLWVMNEYGDVESMMKMFSISFDDLPRKFNWPIHMLEDDTLITYRPQQLYYYKDGRVSCINDCSGLYKHNKNAYVYSETLISPVTFLQGYPINHRIRGHDKRSSRTVPKNACQTTRSANQSCGKHSSDKAPENACQTTRSANQSCDKHSSDRAPENVCQTTRSANQSCDKHSSNKAPENVCQTTRSANQSCDKHSSDKAPDNASSSIENASSSMIIANNFSATTSHSSDTMPENAFVATNFSATTNHGEHVVAKKRWLNSCLQRLCFYKSF